MKEATRVVDTIKDRWESAGALHVPPLAFGNSAPGSGFTYGVVLPCPVEGAFHNKPYEEVFDMEPFEIQDPLNPGKMMRNPNYGQPKRWPPRGTNPVGEAKQNTVFYLAICGFTYEGKTGDHFKGIELMSEANVDAFKATSQAGDPDDLEFLNKVKKWGLRRLYITGGSLQPQLDTLIRKTTRRPASGAIVSAHSSLQPRGKGLQGNERIFEVEYLAPTPESLEVVRLWLKEAFLIEQRQADKAAQSWGSATPQDDATAPPAQVPAMAGAPASAPVPAAPAAEDEPPF